MGQKNKEQLEELLNRIEKDRTTSNTDFQSTTSSTGSIATTSTSTTGSTSVGFTRTGYNADWRVKDDLDCGDRVVEMAKQGVASVDAIVPRSMNPHISETCGFAAAIREGLWAKTGDFMEEIGVPTSYIKTRDGDTDKLRFWTSLLESYNIPWTISEVKFVNPAPKASERQVILEFGVTNKSVFVEDEVRNELKKFYSNPKSSNRLECLQSSHSDGDTTYFPLASRLFGVVLPGVFETRELSDLDGLMDVVRHERVVKSGGGSGW